MRLVFLDEALDINPVLKGSLVLPKRGDLLYYNCKIQKSLLFSSHLLRPTSIERSRGGIAYPLASGSGDQASQEVEVDR